jgi:hypothetical protein
MHLFCSSLLKHFRLFVCLFDLVFRPKGLFCMQKRRLLCFFLLSSSSHHFNILKIMHLIYSRLLRCIIYTPFHFHFLVHLHFNLVSSLLATFSNRMATEMIYQMIECYQFSCQFAVVSQKRYVQKRSPLILSNTEGSRLIQIFELKKAVLC